jgi:hypothetical protein
MSKSDKQRWADEEEEEEVQVRSHVFIIWLILFDLIRVLYTGPGQFQWNPGKSKVFNQQ